jgi:preprotein translocase subunit YajC
MVANLKRGNKVLTAGGIFGVVSKAMDGSETVSVEIASGITVEIARTMISEVRGDEKIKKSIEKEKPVLKSKSKSKK